MWIWNLQPEALDAIADKAIERNIGARGLRAVMEGLLTKVMYEIPSDPTVVKAVITKECVEGTARACADPRPQQDQLFREAEPRQKWRAGSESAYGA